MSILFLRDKYKDFVNSANTTLRDMEREFDRIDVLLAHTSRVDDDDLLVELSDELLWIFDMLDEAIQEFRRDQNQAEENYKYELNFKPNR
jgi:hypothetical protein